jgi:dipeptidyl aminopeptidase/acylaminoacyl peptidase
MGGERRDTECLARTRRRLLLTAAAGAVGLALSCSASGNPVLVAGKAVTTVTSSRVSYRGWLEVSSLSGDDKRALTRPLGGSERRYDYSPTWSPDGSQVAFARWTPKQLALMVVNDDGTGLHPLAEFSHRESVDARAYAVSTIRWSPDGKSLAYLVSRPSGRQQTEEIYVASSTSAGQRLLAALPRKPFGYFSLFGWAADGGYLTYAFSRGEPLIFQYEGPAQLKTVSSEGIGRRTLLVEDAVTAASWSPDGSLVYVRHCADDPCQLVVLDPRGPSRPLTHFKPWRNVVGWDDLPFARRPTTGGIVYTHGRTVYEVSPTTEKARTIRTLRCPRKRCHLLEDEIYLAGITTDGRFALIDHENYGGDSEFRRDYRLELDSGALTPIHLATASPAGVYLP